MRNSPPRLFRPVAISLALALTAAACGQSASDNTASELEATEQPETGDGAETTTADSNTDNNTPADAQNFDYSTVDYDAPRVGSAIQDRFDADFPPPVIDPNLIVSGGPPPDGIPSIDVPQFVSPADADFITSDEEPVIAIEVNGDARAYPVQILTWHELVNDVVGDVPVAIAYCPLCNSAVAFERDFGKRTLTFGTSGSLYQSALVMYDRQTESLWAHFTGQGVVGHFAGAELVHVPVQTVSFGAWREANPDGKVLSTDTGFQRSYGSNPYVGYDQEDTGPIGSFFNGEVDPRLLAKARIVGVDDDSGSVAVRLDDLREAGALPVTEAGRNLVVFHQAGLVSALDTGAIAEGKEVGQTGVFVAESDGQSLTFSQNDDGSFQDDQTGSTWNIFGTATAGDLEGNQLEAVPHLDTFWFAWATYQPDTVIVNP